MLTFVRSSSSVLVVISSMAVRICNHLHARQAQSINDHFLQGYLSLTPTCAGLLESRASELGLLKSTFHDENFICRLSWSISAILVQFTLEMHVTAQNCAKNSLKTSFSGVQGRSRSSMLINSKSLSPVLVIISSMSVLICNRAYTTQDNCGKITTF